jgi:hypothetical protein
VTRALDLTQGQGIADDDPITLAVASKVVLRGVITVSTLRAEIRRGNLEVERIGKNLFTTPAYIKQMRERCRVQSSRPASISERTEKSSSGSSATKGATDELAALKGIATALTNGSLSTLSKRTARSQHEVGVPIPFPSRK